MEGPTFYGYIETSYDSLLVLEAVLLGILFPINQRLTTEQRKNIKSGQVYVFEEQSSGIKRWTEGRSWGPSRILGHFLIYRELAFKNNFEEDKSRPLYLENGLLKKTISFQYLE